MAAVAGAVENCCACEGRLLDNERKALVEGRNDTILDAMLKRRLPRSGVRSRVWGVVGLFN